MKSFPLLICMLSAVGAATLAQAQTDAGHLMNIQFGGGNSAIRVGQAAAGVTTNDFWNLYNRDGEGGQWLTNGVAANLKLADGTPTTASVNVVNGPGLWVNGYPDNMFSGYLYPFNGGDINVTLSDLAAGTYTIYVYAHGGPPDEQNSRINLISGDTNYGTAATATNSLWRSTNWVEGGQFVRFSNVTVSEGRPVLITASPDGTTFAFINGVQLVREPEPPQFALINVDFGTDGTPIRTGKAAVGIGGSDFWNRYSRDDGNGGYKHFGTLTNLQWSSGVPSGAHLAISNAPGAWGNGHPDAMFGGYLYPFNGGNIEISVNALPQGIYSVYAYAHGGPPDAQNARVSLRVGNMFYGSAATATNGLWRSTNWIEGGQFIKFANVRVGPGESLALSSLPDATSDAFINGLQLVRESDIQDLGLINVQFGTDGTPLRTGPAATGNGETDFWNRYSRDNGSGGYLSFGGITNLQWSTHTPSGAQLTISNAPGSWGNGFPDSMFGGYLYPLGPGNIGVTLQSLPAGTYEFYVYAHGGPPNQQNSVVELTAGTTFYGVGTTSSNSDWSLPEWQPGRQFVKFAGVVITDGSPVNIVVSPDAAPGVAAINGLQIRRTTLATNTVSALSILPGGSGIFTNSVTVSIHSAPVGTEVRYTLDGSIPTVSSALYQSPFVLTNTATVRARGFVSGVSTGGIVSSTFQRMYVFNDDIPSAWRITYFGPNYQTDARALADADPDSDGTSNAQEFITGTNPLDPNSGFLTQIRMLPTVTWRSVPSTRYQILRKQSPQDAAWTVVGEMIATSTNSTFVDFNGTNSLGFYSVQPGTN